MKSFFSSEYHRQYSPVLLLYSILQLSFVVCPCLCNSLTEYELVTVMPTNTGCQGLHGKATHGDRELENLHYSRTPKQRMNNSTNQRCIFRSESKQKVTLPTSQGPRAYVQLLEKAACRTNTAASRKELRHAWDTIINKKCQELAKRSVHLSQVSAEYMLQ